MVSDLRLAVAAVLCLLSTAVSAVTSPASIGSDLTILLHNDLYGPSSPRQAAVIAVGTSQSKTEAESACAALGEALWRPENSRQGLGFLRYLDYDGNTDQVGVYWVGSSSGCTAITTLGNVQTMDCDTNLKALCSQSAPWSSKATAADTSAKWQTSVETGRQKIVGYRDKVSFRFLGIPYAPRPARFGYSKYQSPADSTNLSALAYGPQCMQPGCTNASCSEDCLSLNIWTPYLPHGKTSAARKKAVMVWIHGGGFVTGSGTDTTFDGGNMASRGDVVVVTINYRLGTLGFLALDNIVLRGNYGLGDQITALDWLHEHIEDFGGDKDRITIFGQSAGAASVRALIASPQAKGKFSRAIMQSNPAGAQYASTFSHYLTIPEATALTGSILNTTGCNQTDKAIQLACLRAQDPVVLTAAQARYPVVDGTYLTSNELPLGDSAPPTGVPVLMGVMRDDGGPFSKFSKSGNTSQALTEQGFNATGILSSNEFVVPSGPNTTLDIFNLTARVTTDAEFRCLAQSTAVAGSANGVFPAVYSYEFHRGYQIVEWSPNPPTCEAPVSTAFPYGDTSKEYFKCHSGDLYYVFGTLIRQGRVPRDEDDVPFSQYIVDTWTSFGRTQDPNPAQTFLAARDFTNTTATARKSSIWRPVRADKPMLRILDVVPRDEGFSELKQCEVVGFSLSYYSKP